MTASARLGAFDLAERIGEGGMGRVFRGVHRRSGLEVAVKTIRKKAECEKRRWFHREVQAQAGIAHPGVVYLLDYGIVDTDTALQSAGRLDADCPYVVMELADHGTVRDCLPFESWNAVRSVVLQVLDALAATHARDIIHRDLKPANLLIFEGRGGQKRVKLADFGIAHVFSSREEGAFDQKQLGSGTPLYMPPEQLRGRWRRFGPWTDIYALGCLTWEILCGRPPFVAENLISLCLSHCEEERPALCPDFAVPDELEWWIHRAMAIDPERRFRHAADAAAALPPELESAQSTPLPDPFDETRKTGEGRLPALAPTLGLTELPTRVYADEDESPESAGRDGSALGDVRGNSGIGQAPAVEAPPLPPDWRREYQFERGTDLVDTGLGLFGLRSIPFVDRDEDRELLWQLLREVIDQGATRLALISGPPGVGKSALAEAIVTRARETGAVRALRAVHDVGGQRRGDGLVGMVHGLLRTEELSRDELFEYLYKRLPPLEEEDPFRQADARALTEFLIPLDSLDEPVGPRYDFSSPRQRSALLSRLLARIGRRRSPLVWIDDLQWGSEAVDWLEFLFEKPEFADPVLVIATVAADVLRRDDEMAERICDFLDCEGVVHIDLDRLGPDDHRTFVERLLPLEPELVDLLAESTEGNPFFAQQLVGRWIDGDHLEKGDQGLRIRNHQGLDVPGGIRELWISRLVELVQSYSSVQGSDLEPVLEMAVALGRQVDERQWRRICAEAQLSIPRGLVTELAERGFVQRSERGFIFAHGSLVETLTAQARRAGRWNNHHRRCAQLLERRSTVWTHKTGLRCAYHWIAAEEPEKALQPLREAFDKLRKLGDVEQAEQVRKKREELLEVLGVEDGDRRATENKIHRAYYLSRRGRPAEAEALLRDAFDHGTRANDHRNLARAHSMMGILRSHTGAIQQAHRHFEQAVEHASRSSDPALQTRLLRSLGWSSRMTGRPEEAERYLEQSRAMAHEAGDRFQELSAISSLAVLRLNTGDHEGARQMLEGALPEVRHCGFRALEHHYLGALGDIALSDGRYGRARDYFGHSERIAEEIGGLPDVALFKLNRAQVEVYEGNFRLASEKLKEADELFERLGSKEWKELRNCIALALSCARRDWDEVDRLLSRYQGGWPDDAYTVRDQPLLLEFAARRTEEAVGRVERVDRLLRLAHQAWIELGDQEAVQRVSRQLEG